MRVVQAVLIAVLSLSAAASGAEPAIIVDVATGTLQLPAFEVPLSSYMSEEAKQRFLEDVRKPAELGGANIAEVRAAVNEWYGLRVARALKIFSVEIEQGRIAGRSVAIITPRAGVAARNRHRVLINLHGGGFMVGAGNGALAESIPVAGMAGMKVVSVDYRMAPEYRFPAASEDVISVYRELLKEYEPRGIGMFGCSAGAVLTAEVMAALQQADLPLPGAIGLFCLGADAAVGGDARYIAATLDVSLGKPARPPAPQPNPPPLVMPYFDGTDLRDPRVSPVWSRDLLRRFPPTLLISGTRDLGLSSIVHTHAELIAAGAEARLHVWEGMGHNFLVEMDLPESHAAYMVIARHFDVSLVAPHP
jgi:acetyl esterase/lipase